MITCVRMLLLSLMTTMYHRHSTIRNPLCVQLYHWSCLYSACASFINVIAVVMFAAATVKKKIKFELKYVFQSKKISTLLCTYAYEVCLLYQSLTNKIDTLDCMTFLTCDIWPMIPHYWLINCFITDAVCVYFVAFPLLGNPNSKLVLMFIAASSFTR